MSYGNVNKLDGSREANPAVIVGGVSLSKIIVNGLIENSPQNTHFMVYFNKFIQLIVFHELSKEPTKI